MTVILAVFCGMGVGILGYLAFGKTCSAVLILNLPLGQFLSYSAKIGYIITIIGSYVVLINPLFNMIENSQWYKNFLFEKG